MQSIPQFTASRAPVARTVPAQRSQPNQHELRAQQTAISRAIQREPVHIPRKLLRQVDSEDEDDFDYDDGFIVDDMDEPQDWNSELRKVTKYYPEQYDDEDFDDRDMEVRDFAELEREDLRSRYYGSLHVKRPSR